MVVLIRPCSIRLTARFERSASRWPCVRRSLTVFRWGRMCVLSLNDSVAQRLNGSGELGVGGVEIDETGFELHAEAQAEAIELFLDLVERLFAEVAVLEHLLLGLLRELAHGGDVRVVEAVCRANG